MKKVLLFLLLCVSFNLVADNIRGNVEIHKKGSAGTHLDQPIPDVEPTVYYDNDEREITIVGTGFASYYDVEIKSVTTSMVYISTRVDGSYDTIDVSSLPDDSYLITLDPPVNVSFEGTFSVY